MAVLSKQDLCQHVWLVQEVRHEKRSHELEALGFNYFSTSRATGEPLAMKLLKLSRWKNEAYRV